MLLNWRRSCVDTLHNVSFGRLGSGRGQLVEVLADSPFGDVALFAAICLVGGVSIVALRRIPIVVLTAGIAAVVLLVFLVFAGSRLALRAGRKWTPRN
jgi:hypothetical protein